MINIKMNKIFYNCLKSIGFKLNIYGEETGSDYKIGCPTKLLNIYKEYSKAEKVNCFIECLDIVKSCFNGEPIIFTVGFSSWNV